MNCQKCNEERRQYCSYEKEECWELKGTQYKGCPFKYIKKQSLNFMTAFKFYRQGYLPNEGGWLCQSAKLMDAFRVIEKELAEIEAKNDK